MTLNETNQALALGALGWILEDNARADRLVALTGLTPDALRTGLSDVQVLSAILAFLEGHEPDLIACAEALDVPPVALVDARRSLDA